MNYIKLNGVNSNTINGLLIQELPPITKPKIRTIIEEIDGRDGDITTPLGYSAYDKEFTIGLYKDFDINAIISYFNSKGEVVFNNEPDKYYRYEIIEQIDFERLVRFRTAVVKMHVQPFKYKDGEQQIEVVATETTAEGTNITINNTENGASFLDMQLKGQTSQTTYQGYNLLDVNTGSDGLTLVDNNYYITNVNQCYVVKSGITLKANITYYYKFKLLTRPSTPTTFTTYLDGTPDTSIGFSNINRADNFNLNQVYTRTITPTSDKVMAITQFGNSNSEKFQFQLWLTTDNSKNTFEKYVGGTASPNPSYPQNVNVVTGNTSVKICNKNLWQNANNPIITTYGITLTTNDDNSVTLTGSATNSSIYFTNVKKIMASDIKDGNYTLSFGNGSNTSFLAYRLRKYNGTTKTEIKAPTTLPIANYTYTLNLKNLIDDDTIQVELDLVRYGTGANDQTLYPQIEFGNTATSYVAHQEQNYEIDLPVENLFDGQLEVGNISWGADISDNNICRSTNYIEVKGMTNYIFSIDGIAHRIIVSMYDEDKTFIADSGETGVASTTGIFKTYTSTKYIRFRCYNGDKSLFENGQIQIEEGTRASAYTPYGTTPIELCKIGTAQDYIYKNNGNWFIHKEIRKAILDGTNNYAANKSSTTNNTLYVTSNISNIKPVANNGVLGNIMSSHFKAYTTDQLFSGTHAVGIAKRDGSGISLAFGLDTELTTKELVNAWLAEVKPVIYYEVLTPTETQITDENLIAQLEGLRNASTYINQTNIITSGDLAPIIYAKTYTMPNASFTITNSGNIYSKPKIVLWGIGTDSLYLNGSQVLSIDFGETLSEITIDSENMEATSNGVLANRKVTGNYSNLKLNPGNNTLSFTGSVEEFHVYNYNRWI